MKKSIFNIVLATLTGAFTVYFYFGRLMVFGELYMGICYGTNLAFWIIYFCCYPIKRYSEADYDHTIIKTTVNMETGETKQSVSTPADQASSGNFWFNLFLVFVCFVASPVAQLVVIVIRSLKLRNVAVQAVSILLAIIIMALPIVGVLTFVLPAHYQSVRVEIETTEKCTSWGHQSSPQSYHYFTVQFVYMDGTTSEQKIQSHQKDTKAFDKENLKEIRIAVADLHNTEVVSGMTLDDDVYVWKRNYFSTDKQIVLRAIHS